LGLLEIVPAAIPSAEPSPIPTPTLPKAKPIATPSEIPIAIQIEESEFQPGGLSEQGFMPRIVPDGQGRTAK
jgi:hypothetical protein